MGVSESSGRSFCWTSFSRKTPRFMGFSSVVYLWLTRSIMLFCVFVSIASVLSVSSCVLCIIQYLVVLYHDQTSSGFLASVNLPSVLLLCCIAKITWLQGTISHYTSSQQVNFCCSYTQHTLMH